MKEALFEAIGQRNFIAVEDFLRNGADVNAADTGEETPLMKAVMSNSIELVRLIVKYKPDIFRKNNLGLTAMDLTQDMENQDVLLLLMSPTSVAISNEEKYEKIYQNLDNMNKQKDQLKMNNILLEQKLQNYSVKNRFGYPETLKTKALYQLLIGGIRDSVTISKKILDKEIQKTNDTSGMVVNVLTQTAPMIQGQLDGIVSTLGMALVIGIARVYDYFCKRKERLEVKRISDAFSNDFGSIDDNLLEDISHAVIYRYYDQLHQLTLSTTVSQGGQERPDPRPGDGVFVLATAIINRIISSIIRGRNNFYHSNGEEIPVPVVQRCIHALYKEIWDEKSCAQSLKTEEIKETAWTVKGVLDRTGIKYSNEKNEESFYTKSGSTKHDRYGFRRVSTEGIQEIAELKFQQIRVLKEEKYSLKNDLPQRFINGQNRKEYHPLPEADMEFQAEKSCCQCIIL